MDRTTVMMPIVSPIVTSIVRRPGLRRSLLLAASFALLPGPGRAVVPVTAAGPAAGAPAATPAAPVPSTPPQVAAPPVAVPPVAALAKPAPVDPAVLLLQQATFWRAQNVPDKAVFSLRRLLELQPGNLDALGLLAQIDVEQGNLTEGQASYDRIKQANPHDPRLAAVAEALRIGPIDQDQLAQARTLVGQGKNRAAVKLYQAAFHGPKPPPSLAVEYYLALGNTDIDGFETARKALAAIVATDPDDAATQLAYARLLCNREFTRADGLTRLQALAKVPAVAASARMAWREVMLWQGASIESMRQLKAYLADNKSDPQIDAQLKDFEQTVPTEGQQARDRGFVEIQDQKWTEAENDFIYAIGQDAKDWKSMAMLAAIRNHQNRTQDAHDLIAQALAIKPEQTDFIQKASGGDWSYNALVAKGLIGKATPGDAKGAGAKAWTVADARRAARAGAAQWQAQYRQVSRLAAAGKDAQAEALMMKLMRGRNRPGSYATLGDMQAAAGHTAAAEANYRKALALQAGNGQAAAGMARLYEQLGRPDEAARYYAQAQQAYGRSGGNAQLAGLTSLRAQQIRARADAATTLAEQVPLYRQAVQIDPNDPWIRLSLARALSRQGATAEAQQTMAPLADRRDTQAIEANIYWAQSTNNTAAASDYVARLPARSRTAQMRALQDQVALQQDLARIEAVPQGADRRRALLALAGKPDPTGERVSAIGSTLVKLGDQGSVQDAVQAGLAATRSPTAAQKVAYSGALLQADDPDRAATLVSGVDDSALPRQSTVQLDDVRDNIAVARSDRLNAQNKPAAAYDNLAPRLAANPNDTNLRLALSRLYAANGKPQEALSISRSVLKDNEGDMGVRRQAISSAIASRDYGLANRLTQDGIRQSPSDPQLYLLSASIAQAQGANMRAVHDLQTARELRQRQLAQAAP